MLSPLTHFPASALDTLTVTTDFPSVVDGKTQYAKGEYSLPNSVVLKSNSQVSWDYIEPRITNEFGDISQGSSSAFGRAISVKIEAIGRRANVTVASAVAVKTKITVRATVDGKQYSITREIDFKVSSSNDVYRFGLPKLPEGFKIEVENPDVGSDSQTVIRARITFQGESSAGYFNILRIDKRGYVLENSSSGYLANGEWRVFDVSADSYSRYGFDLLVSWHLLVGPQNYNSTAETRVFFERKIPINVNFNLNLTPNSYAWNDQFFDNYRGVAGRPHVKFKFNCPSFSDTAATYKCTIQALSNFDTTFLKKAGYDTTVKYLLSGQIPATLCTHSSEVGERHGCASDDFPPRTKTNLMIGFDKPITVTVASHLKQTGYTLVYIKVLNDFFNQNGFKFEPSNGYYWTSSNYEKRKKGASTPSASLKNSLSASVRRAMSYTCQVLPKGFSKYPITYSKNVTSQNGVPGHLFIINKSLTVQIYPLMSLISPSTAPKDISTWRNWGCGGYINF
jgi:hypothetical protein